MGRKTLNYDGVKKNKREFHASKQPINLDSVNVNKIVMSTKVKHGDGSLKYFIGYVDGDVVKPLFITLPQMRALIKCVDSGCKICYI